MTPANDMNSRDRIREAIAGNEQCSVGILARQRVAITDHGSLSYHQDRELFCLIRPEG